MVERSYPKFVRQLEEAGLKKELEGIALRGRVSLHDMFNGARVKSIVAARRAAYARLMMRGKSLNEIARLFGRSPNHVWKMTRGVGA